VTVITLRHATAASSITMRKIAGYAVTITGVLAALTKRLAV
jgi:hypothetical protein